jgi:glycosyltransferase involved in cell wall biosynthesis
MACGVPVVCSDVPGSADLLRASRCGLLVPVDDQAAAVEAVAELLLDAPRRAGLALHARAEVEASYTMAIMERRLRDFYAGLLP